MAEFLSTNCLVFIFYKFICSKMLQQINIVGTTVDYYSDQVGCCFWIITVLACSYIASMECHALMFDPHITLYCAVGVACVCISTSVTSLNKSIINSICMFFLVCIDISFG